MEVITVAMLILLGFCIVGTTGLLLFVAWYIASDIYQGVKSRSKPTNVCDWYRKSEIDDYRTSCDHEFYDASESGDPITDTMTFCPYCGGEIKIK